MLELLCKKNKKDKKQVELIIPEKNKDMRRVYAYLCNERFIDKEIINAFVKSGLIYEDAKYHNVVFLGKDESGVIRHIQKRTTSHKSDFKGNVAGSNAEYSFRYIGTSDKLYVFEAPIDMLAFITLHKKDWKQHSYVALCSTAECSAMQIINKHSSVKEKDVDVNKIMRKLNMTQKQKQAINLIMGGMNPYQVSKHLKVSNVAIYERVKQVRKKYIKVFGLPYESYVY